ncbi:hypothetical protein AB0M83_30255 [Amycolatopsis sp. NPDC051106]|uniref:hypothetical protein n=1 Tax=unclassified Amycolatopsis TaxID=2618356 RepID=UPI003414BF01
MTGPADPSGSAGPVLFAEIRRYLERLQVGTVERGNRIAHEADRDPERIDAKNPITVDDVDHWSDVLRWMEDTQTRLRSAAAVS